MLEGCNENSMLHEQASTLINCYYAVVKGQERLAVDEQTADAYKELCKLKASARQDEMTVLVESFMKQAQELSYIALAAAGVNETLQLGWLAPGEGRAGSLDRLLERKVALADLLELNFLEESLEADELIVAMESLAHEAELWGLHAHASQLRELSVMVFILKMERP